MPDRRVRLREDARFRVLQLLRENPELSQRELASRLEISTGALHYLLKALIDKWLIKIDNFSSSTDRRRYVYLLTPQGISEKSRLTRDFLQRKLDEYDALQQEIALLKADLDGETNPTAGEAA